MFLIFHFLSLNVIKKDKFAVEIQHNSMLIFLDVIIMFGRVNTNHTTILYVFFYRVFKSYAI